ncbi:Hypothetical predicted protein [Lecanosticta acicola]|uniref:Uncharacterized protein n=1 Tax=Lecanosticta acicola TaxID=111012 RepID=A0AAI9E9N6_9PEZI|nr:Hypothetical predicted protein [Lecanosticta acicola]
MPPVTPSPHRFLAGSRRGRSPPKQPKHGPGLRSQAPRQHQTPQTRTPAQNAQFAQTPRFSFGKPAQAPSPPRPTTAQALRASIGPSEDVEEAPASQDDEDEMLLDNEQAEALPTTESTQQRHDEEAWTNELPYSPKRRKLEEAAQESPAKSMFKHPTTPASANAPRPQQFTRAGGVASTVNDRDSQIRRPPFLRSSLAPLEPAEPLPDAFSPHRRGEKFVAGGMAATMQQWVIETGQGAAHSRRGQSYLRGEDYVLRVKAETVIGSGPILMQGKLPDDEEMNLMLVREARKTSSDVVQGSMVGVRAPTWEMELDGRKWTVGVDWKILPF